MNKKYKLALFILLPVGVTLLATLWLRGHDIAVLNSKGIIANRERDLMITATLLMLIVVIPVFALTFFIAWKYRASNAKAKYKPDWDHSRVAEFTWWAVPTVIIFVLAVITWKGTHELDPFKPLSASTEPVAIQVVALQWKWLFIYPQQNIASVNLVQFPEDTPINFEITADAPMNSFWIPQLGGQVYAMSGMKTRLHLMADETGNYRGSSANISGEGFAGMKFTARASAQTDFEKWLQSAKNSPAHLSFKEYNKLAKPSKGNLVTYYSSTEADLLGKIVRKFTTPTLDREYGNRSGGLSNYGEVHN